MAKLEIEIGAVTDGLNKGLKDAESKLQAFSKKATQIGKNLSLAVTAPLTGLAAIGIRNFDRQAQAIGQVETALLSTGNAAGKTSEQLQKTASELQNISTFGDEEILQKVTAQLLTFTNIAGDAFDRTQKAALDLATRLGGDLQSASIQLGKALNDPVANLSALSRSGIQFSEAQKELINSLVETNRLADAQTIILDELEKQYGGSAEAAAKLGLGPLKQLSNQFGDLLEDVGKIILEALQPFIERAGQLITRLQNLDDSTKKIIVTIGALVAGVGPLLITLGSIIKILPIIVSGFTALTGPIGLTVLAVGSLTAGIIALKNGWRPFKILLEDTEKPLNNFTEATKLANEAQEILNKAVGVSIKQNPDLIESVKAQARAKIEATKVTLAQINAQRLANLAIKEEISLQDQLFFILNGGLTPEQRALNREQERRNKINSDFAKQSEEINKELNQLTLNLIKLGTGFSEASGNDGIGGFNDKLKKLADLANEKVFAQFEKEARLFNEELRETISLQKRIEESSKKIAGSFGVVDIAVNLGNLPPVIEIPEVDDSSLTRFILRLKDFQEQIGEILSFGIANTIGDFAFSIGEAIASGADALKAAGSSLLSGLASILNQLGQLAIGAGIAIEAIRESLIALKGVKAIAAGVALVALAGVISGTSRRLAGNFGGVGSAGGGAAVGSGISETFGGGATGFSPFVGDREIRLVAETDGAKLKYVIDQANAYQN